MIPVAALFVRRDSVYKGMPGVDCYDVERDALTWPGGCPVVAHPPCRLWGRLRSLARCADPDAERDLGRWAVHQVQRWGGVLEHPAFSGLWSDRRLPRPGDGLDDHGGRTVGILQYDWGHRAAKPTWIYVVGTYPAVDVLRLGEPTHTIGWSSRRLSDGSRARSGVSKRENEATPPALAEWLVATARECGSLLAGRSNTGQSAMGGTTCPKSGVGL